LKAEQGKLIVKGRSRESGKKDVETTRVRGRIMGGEGVHREKRGL